MDELEQRLTNVLTRASERADPAVARLRNPAESPRRRASSFRPPTWLVTAASGVAVAAVAVGLAAGIPAMNDKGGRPAVTAAPGQGKADGTHPLWPLGVTEDHPLTFDRVTTPGQVVVPVPHTVDPALAPEVTKVPLLVTEAGTIRFTGSAGVHLLARRDNGIFVAVTGADGGDGLHDVAIQLVAADNSRRTILHAAQAGSVAISPDGTTLAFSTWLGRAAPRVDPAVTLVDVASGRVLHRLAGQFTQVTWASGSALVLGGDAGEATSLAWRAPWTGEGEQIPVRAGTAMTVAGGAVALDDRTGCLQKLDGNAAVTAANCHGWTSAGHVSPDGRLVSLEWAGGSTTRYGYLDLGRNQVRSWPVTGQNPSWLGPADVLLTEAGSAEAPRTARCDLTAGTCVLAPEESAGRGTDWLGG